MSAFKSMYDVDVSASLISQVTDSVMDQVREWQHRPLDAVYPILYLDGIVLKIRQDKRVIQKTIYLGLGVNLEGQKELLGLWLSTSEGAKFWLQVLTELQNRGVEQVLIACVDGLSSFPEAIQAAFPLAKVQLCIVHMVRNSLRYVTWKDYKAVTTQALDDFATKWDEKYPQISRSRRSHWKNRKLLPSDESAVKVIYLAIREASKKWTMPIHHCKSAMNRFTIEFKEQLVPYLK